jgi:hypothetical protein
MGLNLLLHNTKVDIAFHQNTMLLDISQAYQLSLPVFNSVFLIVSLIPAVLGNKAYILYSTWIMDRFISMPLPSTFCFLKKRK